MEAVFQVPLPVSLVAVSFPDLLWSFLVPAGVEKVKLDPNSPLQKFIVFEEFPYSHSLILGNVWSLIVAVVTAAVLNNPLVVPVFVAGSVSHWILDTVVYLKELPVLGFDGDTKVGLGLWKRGPLAFVVEIAFYGFSASTLSGLACIGVRKTVACMGRSGVSESRGRSNIAIISEALVHLWERTMQKGT